MRAIASAVGGRNRLRRDPRDEGLDARVNFAADVVAAGKRLAQAQPQLFK